jgi:hypothetical protein
MKQFEVELYTTNQTTKLNREMQIRSDPLHCDHARFISKTTKYGVPGWVRDRRKISDGDSSGSRITEFPII